jgi:CRP/FNR family cyclic AMP-dependent transcriptional regulator
MSSAAMFAEVPLFSSCSKKELRTVAQRAAERHIDPGTVLVTEGEAGESFFVIFGGLAEVHRNNRKVAVIGPGDFFGDLALLDSAPRDATVVARTALELVVLDQAEFFAMIDESRAFRRELLIGLANRLRTMDARLSD